MTQEQSMLEVIQNIPNQILKRLQASDEFSQKLTGVTQDKVLIVASGTSYNAAFTVKDFTEKKLGLPVTIDYPNHFYHHFNESLYDERTLYVFVSQGGTTKTVLETIEKVNNLGGVTVSLTESLATPIAQAAKISFEIGSEKEPFIFRTAGYSLTAVTLYLTLLAVALEKGNITKTEWADFYNELVGLKKDLPEVMTLAEEWYQKHQDILLSRKALFFAGGGSLWPIAQEADIKFMEMIPIFTNSFEIEEIIHGPQNCFNDSMGFFFLAENKMDEEKAVSIDAFIKKEVGAFSQILTTTKTDSEMLYIASKSSNFHSLVFMTFFQVVGFKLATDSGRNLTQKMYPQIDHYINKTVEVK